MKFSRFISLTIIVSVFAMVLGSVVNPYNLIKTTKPVIEAAPVVPNSTVLLAPCVGLSPKQGNKKIVLQINDIQAYAWRDTAIKMAKDAFDRQLPVVASVIPADIHTDTKLVQFLRENDCKLDIAQQGTRVSATPELKGMTNDQVKERAIEGKSILQWVLKTDVSTFVPPQNWYTVSHLKAFDEVGYKTVSTEGMLRKKVGVSSYRFWKKELKSSDQIINECNYAFSRNIACVLFLYPAYFDGDEYAKYTELLDTLVSIKGIEFTTFSKLSK